MDMETIIDHVQREIDFVIDKIEYLNTIQLDSTYYCGKKNALMDILAFISGGIDHE